MVVLSPGMQKSGSGYFYNIINELLVSAGCKDAREIKNKRNLDNMMQWHNNNIGELSFEKLFKLWKVSVLEGAFVVKTHEGPDRSAKIMSKLGLIKIVYSYRDPRDVLLSAIDHGKMILAEGEAHTFAKMVEFDKALENVKDWLGIWKEYANMSGIFMVKYEEMMEAPNETLEAIAKFLGVSVDAEKRQEIIWKFSKNNPDSDRTGMHFNKAKVYRYKTEMTQEQKEKCKEAFGTYLESMCYDIG